MHSLRANPRTVKPPQTIAAVADRIRAALSITRQDALRRYNSERVYIGTGTARRAVALGLSVEYRLWLALHYYHNQQAARPGWLEITPLALSELSGLVGLSVVRVRVLLSQHADNLFWRKAGARLHLGGQRRVARALARRAAVAEPVIVNPFEPDCRCSIPLSALAGGMLQFHAALLAAYIGVNAHGWQGTYAMLARNWQASRGQVQRWIRAAGLTVQYNAGAIPLPAAPDVVEPDQHGFTHPGIWVYSRGRVTYLMFQRGNTYHAACSKENPGKAALINRDLRSLAGYLGHKAICNQATADGFMSGADSVGAHSGPCSDDRARWLAALRYCRMRDLLRSPGWLFERKRNHSTVKGLHAARRGVPGLMYLKDQAVRLLRPGPGAGWWVFWLVFGEKIA